MAPLPMCSIVMYSPPTKVLYTLSRSASGASFSGRFPSRQSHAKYPAFRCSSGIIPHATKSHHRAQGGRADLIRNQYSDITRCWANTSNAVVPVKRHSVALDTQTTITRHSVKFVRKNLARAPIKERQAGKLSTRTQGILSCDRIAFA